MKKPDAVSIMLMGEHFMHRGNKLPLFTTYENFMVNGRTQFLKFQNADIKKYYKYGKNLKAGETLIFSVDVKKPGKFSSFQYIHFDCLSFITWFACLLFGYYIIRKFLKKHQGSDGLDAWLVLLFGFLLVIPMLHISDIEISEQENRKLARKPSLMVEGNINQRFGIQFDAWFNDHFNGREIFIRLYNSIKTWASDKFMVGGWYVDRRTKWIMQIPNVRAVFTPEQLALMSHNVDKLKRFAAGHNMKVYILVPPRKYMVYGREVLPNYAGDIEELRTIQAINYIKKHNNIDIIYPYEELIEFAKTDMAFFKTDHHWTDGGAFVAYKKLIYQVKKDFPYIKTLKEDDFDYLYSNKVKVTHSAGFHNGSEYKKTNLNDEDFLDVDYKYFKHKQDTKLTTKKYDNTKDNYFVRNISFAGKNRYNLTLFGDSFVENLEPIMPYSFKNTLKIYTWVPSHELSAKNLNIQRFETDMLANKTNILVVVFSNIGRLMHIYKD